MRDRVRSSVNYCFLVLLTIGFFMNLPSVSSAGVINQDIVSSTVWDLSGSPYYITQEITVKKYSSNNTLVTLTIADSNASVDNPIVVKLGPGIDVYVNGIIRANNVIFTSINDDDPSLGPAYTSSNGNPLPGDWQAFHLYNNQSNFDGCSFKYGDRIECLGSSPEFFDCRFELMSHYGLYCSSYLENSSSANIHYCTFLNIGETFTDNNGDGKYQLGEPYIDFNSNNFYDEGIAIMVISQNDSTESSPNIWGFNDIIMNNEVGVKRGGYPFGLYGNAFPVIGNLRKIIQDTNDKTYVPSIFIGGKISASRNYTLPVVTDTVNTQPLPYTIGSSRTPWQFEIGENTTLTLLTQTVLKFQSGVNFRIGGKIIFPDGDSDIVYFTSINDDSINGRLVGSSSVPKPGDWGTLRFDSDNTITNCYFSHGTEIFLNQLSTDAIFNNNVVLQFSKYDLHCYAAQKPCNLEISLNLLSTGYIGIFCETLDPFQGPASPWIHDNSIIGHSSYPIILKNTCSPDFASKDSDFVSTSYDSNFIQNDNYRAIAVEGITRGDREVTWYKVSNLSYVVLDDFEISKGFSYTGTATDVDPSVLVDKSKTWMENYLVGGVLNPNTKLSKKYEFVISANNSTSVTVETPNPDGVYLTDVAMPVGGDTYSIEMSDTKLYIKDGNTIKFAKGKNFIVKGILELWGNTAFPVSFTSILDDDLGTIIEPGHSEQAAPGDWGNLKIYNNEAKIKHGLFRYGTNFILDSCSPPIDNNVFSNFAEAAILLQAREDVVSPNILNNQIACNNEGIVCYTDPNSGRVNLANPIITGNDFFKNEVYAVDNTRQTNEIDARGNWWADGINGPSGACSGLGDPVSTGVRCCGPGEFLPSSVFTVDNQPPTVTNQVPAPDSSNASTATDISFDILDIGDGLNANKFSVQVDHGDNKFVYIVENGLIQKDPISGTPYDVDLIVIPQGLQFIYNPSRSFALNARVCVEVYADDLAFCPNSLKGSFGTSGYKYCFVIGVNQGLSEGRVTPKAGIKTTQFHYTVNYSDGLGVPPMSTTIFIDGDPYNMALESGVPAEGIYGFTTMLDEGNHDFYFEFISGDGSTIRFPSSSPDKIKGPYVYSDYETKAWPMFRQNQFHNAHSYIPGPVGSVQIDWLFSATGDFMSSPCVDLNNNVYGASYQDGKIYKFDPNGNLSWSYSTGSIISASPAVDRIGNVYVGAYNNRIYGINNTGSLVWQFHLGSLIPNDYVASSPTIGNDDMINQSGNGSYIFNFAKDFSINWFLSAGTFLAKIRSTACIYFDGRTYFGCDDKTLYTGDAEGINPITGLTEHGIPRWSYKTFGGIESSPAVDLDGNVYFGSNDHNIYALSYDGNLLWVYPTDGMIKSSPAIGWDETIYVGSDDHKLYAIRPDGTLKWSYLTQDKITASPAIDANENIFIGSQDGSLYCLSNQGNVNWIWNSPNGAAIDSSVAIGPDGRIYVGAGDTLYALREGVNTAPLLTSGKFSPLLENRYGNNISYSVNYYDKDGDVPTTKYVFVDGIQHDMNLYTGYAANGKYQIPLHLNPGVHTYYFTFTDIAGNSVRLPSNGTYTGPIISLPVQSDGNNNQMSDDNRPSTPPVIMMAGFADTKITSENGGSVKILALVADSENDIKEVEVLYNGIPSGIFLKDDGTQNDGEASDGIYGLVSKVQAGIDKGFYLVELIARDKNSNMSNIWPYITVDMHTDKLKSELDTAQIEKFCTILQGNSETDSNVILAAGYLDSNIDSNLGGYINFAAFAKDSGINNPLYILEGSGYDIDNNNSLPLDNLKDGNFNSDIRCIKFSRSLKGTVPSQGLYLFIIKDSNNGGDILFPFLNVK
jgi:outer membrane protein assembly factor BamB